MVRPPNRKNYNINKLSSSSQQQPLQQSLQQSLKQQSQNYIEPFTIRDYSPSNYVQDKFTQYRIGMDNYYPLQITEIPFYNDVYYSMPNSLGAPIYVDPSYNTLENASFMSNPVYQIQNQFNQNNANEIMMKPNYNGLGGISMERDSYFNTMNAQNKDVNYKDFVPKKDIKKVREPVIKYTSTNKDFINSMIIILLIFILFLSHK